MNLPAQQPSQPDPSLMRASDADRDRVADQLGEALAEGRLTPDEHAQRIDLVYSARTYAELAPILADLPAAAPAAKPMMETGPDLPAPTHPSAKIVAIFGGADRQGRWLVDPHVKVSTVFGGVNLDLSDAVLAQREVTINVSCVMGGVEIKVPPGIRVINSVSAIFGGVELQAEEPDDPNSPVIRLTGFVLMGGLDVQRRLPKAERTAIRQERQMLRDQRRERRRELREQRRQARRGHRS